MTDCVFNVSTSKKRSLVSFWVDACLPLWSAKLRDVEAPFATAPGNLNVRSHIPFRRGSCLFVPCSTSGALLDELLVAIFLGPILTAKLRVVLSWTSFVTDASPSAAGVCSC